MKKLIFTLSGSLMLAVACMLFGHPGSAAAACTIQPGSACGYFTDQPDSATDNVLPSPGLVNATDAGSLKSIMKADLYSGDTHTWIGASFIIDDMLNYNNATGGDAGGGINAGRQYAKDHFTDWENMVDYYATSTNPSYGINWNYQPLMSTFCGSASNPTLDSGYDPNVPDVALYHVHYWSASDCNSEFIQSMPEIQFYWPNNGSFEIGHLCGNVQGHPGKIPMNSPPTGTISVVCNFSLDQQQATVNFNDPDGATNGYIIAGGWKSGTVGSGSTITIPASATDPYTAQAVTLYVQDVGPVGSGAYVPVATANTQVPCVTFNCGSLNETPTLLDPYMNYTLTTNVTNSTTTPPPSSNMSLQVLSPANVVVYNQPSNTVTASGFLLSSTFNPTPTGGTGKYTAQWTLTIPGKSISCSGTFNVVDLPYLSVYGGDASVGISASYNGSSSTCSAQNNTAGIFSWNKYPANYAGAGAQYAVQALAAIEGFASGQDNSPTVTPPTGLSWANAGLSGSQLNPGQGLFGGYSTVTTGDCDFTSDLGNAQVSTSNKTFSATSVPAGSDIWLVKNADVYISGNIAYSSTGGWANVTQIPYFKLVVVGGNIYIGSGVTQLDGVYVAEPQGATGGKIYTCASGFGSPAVPTANGYYAMCNQKLTINGAFVAAQVQFLRTSGSLGQAQTSDTASNSPAAEVFNFTPEVWLPRAGVPSDTGYKAITGLPPVL